MDEDIASCITCGRDISSDYIECESCRKGHSMLIDNNTDAGTLKVFSDVPENVTLPPTGYFRQITVSNWHAINHKTSRVMVDATIPAMIELIMDDGSLLSIWPDGTFVMHNQETGEEWSRIITQDAVIPNPYRS